MNKQDNTDKIQQLRLCADIREGDLEYECQQTHPPKNWYLACHNRPEVYVNNGVKIRLKAWTLSRHIPGFRALEPDEEWHRGEQFVQSDLREGERPLLVGEVEQDSDEWRMVPSSQWRRVVRPFVRMGDVNVVALRRTKRPLPEVSRIDVTCGVNVTRMCGDLVVAQTEVRRLKDDVARLGDDNDGYRKLNAEQEAQLGFKDKSIDEVLRKNFALQDEVKQLRCRGTLEQTELAFAKAEAGTWHKAAEDMKARLRQQVKKAETTITLYKDIVARLKPYFPADSRELEWDVLPATLERFAQVARHPHVAKQPASKSMLLRALDVEYTDLFRNSDQEAGEKGCVPANISSHGMVFVNYQGSTTSCTWQQAADQLLRKRGDGPWQPCRKEVL